MSSTETYSGVSFHPNATFVSEYDIVKIFFCRNAFQGEQQQPPSAKLPEQPLLQPPPSPGQQEEEQQQSPELPSPTYNPENPLDLHYGYDDTSTDFDIQFSTPSQLDTPTQLAAQFNNNAPTYPLQFNNAFPYQFPPQYPTFFNNPFAANQHQPSPINQRCPQKPFSLPDNVIRYEYNQCGGKIGNFATRIMKKAIPAEERKG